jgi:TatD DNase family protein
MLIDTHAHVNFKSFKDDSEEVIKRSLDAGIQIINVGSQYSTSRRAVEMAEKYKTGVWAIIGLHPDHLKDQEWEEEYIKVKTKVEKFDPEKYRELAKSKKVVAIGETGLDYYHGDENKKEQIKTFQEEIKLAIDLDLPVMVHCRNAYKDVLEVLMEEKKKYGEKLRGVIHSYLGRLSYAEEFNKMGFLIAFNGIITYARDYDKVIKGIPLENILTETDCPWLTPVPHRGERNEPAYVRFVAEKLAEIKGMNFDEVAQVTTENARRLFKLNF